MINKTIYEDASDTIWRIKNHFINERNWDYVYKQNLCLNTDAGYSEFKFIAAKEGIPLFLCGQAIMFSWLPILERAVATVYPVHITIYRSASYWFARYNAETHRADYFRFKGDFKVFRAIDFTGADEMRLTSEEVKFSIDILFA